MNAAMRATVAKERLKAARESLRELGRRVSPRYRPGREPLSIDELISPLRYDVLVRRQFFEFLEEHRALHDRDLDEFVEAARSTDYHRWFVSVAVHAIGIADLPPAELEEAFRRRICRSVVLADSVARQGFMAKPPLTIRASAGERTATGKQLGARHYPLDGCHRLALLRQLGRTELRPGEYRVTDQGGPLLDNTARLIPALGLAGDRYYPFVASGYTDKLVLDRDDLIAAIEVAAPDELAEVRSILAADEPRLLG
jgi:hypothetical protein